MAAVDATGLVMRPVSAHVGLRRAVALVDVDTVLAGASCDAQHDHRPSTTIASAAKRRVCAGASSRSTRAMRASVRPNRLVVVPRTTIARSASIRQRWHVESAFSQHRRRFGSTLTVRRAAAQPHAPILRVRTHNGVLLVEAGSGVQQSKRLTETEPDGPAVVGRTWLHPWFPMSFGRRWRLLLPPEPAKPEGGRPRRPDRACLAGIVSVLRTGIGLIFPRFGGHLCYAP